MNDKIKHIAAGTLTFFVGLPCYQLTDTQHLAAAVWATIVSGILLAGCKEFCDMRTEGNKWDWKDLGCTIAGAAVVALFIVAMHFARG
jgi:uncharacterized protein YfiM (DUF2279 family)